MADATNNPMRVSRLECVVCGSSAIRRSGAKYCSPKCKSRAKDARRSAKGRRRPSGTHPMADRDCARCGTTFVVRGDNDRKYCGDTCRTNATTRPPVRTTLTIVKCKCQECGDRFDRKRSTPFCSARCKALYTGKAEAAHRPAKTCPECSVSFVPAYGRGHSRYCTNECSRKATKRVARLAHKARLRVATVEQVNPMRVFERDGWRCHICGKATPRKLRGTYKDRAPELDHIIPLSLGGEHSYRNTACSCRQCNHTKSNSLIGQLRLFG